MKQIEIYIASFILILFSVLSGCSKDEGLYDINPDYIEGEWNWGGIGFYRLRFEKGNCYDPINKAFVANYEIKSDTLILLNEDQEKIYFKILYLDYYKLRLKLIGRKLRTMKMANLRYDNNDLEFQKLIPLDSLSFEGVDHNYKFRKYRLSNFSQKHKI